MQGKIDYSEYENLKKEYEKIKAMGDRTIYYGHGNPTRNGF